MEGAPQHEPLFSPVPPLLSPTTSGSGDLDPSPALFTPELRRRDERVLLHTIMHDADWSNSCDQKAKKDKSENDEKEKENRRLIIQLCHANCGPQEPLLRCVPRRVQLRATMDVCSVV